jgi:hypothetical protein
VGVQEVGGTNKALQEKGIILSSREPLIQVLFDAVVWFGIPMKLVKLSKTCLNETYSRVQLGKHLSLSY